MGISRFPSTVVMPDCDRPYPSIIEFLVSRFPGVGRKVWEGRVATGKVLDEKGDPVGPHTPYVPLKRLRYFREVAAEPEIPFRERILFESDYLIVACKPHFLPVTPGGPFVNECLLNRIRERTGNSDVAPINRIDRMTAGLVLFSARRESRGDYQRLFMEGKVEKRYLAVAGYPGVGCPGAGRPEAGWPDGRREGGEIPETWHIENRIEKGEPWFRMKTAEGTPNAKSRIELLERRGGKALFRLTPVTGKKHQLRLHMAGLGFGILGDRSYPELLPEQEDDFDCPLQLLAKELRFTDPVTGRPMAFRSERPLAW